MFAFSPQFASVASRHRIGGRKREILPAACRAAPLVVFILIYSGCYHYHIRANGDRLNSSYFRRTLFSGAGARGDFIVPPAETGVQARSGLPSSAHCEANGLYEVGISSSWKDAAGILFSFGHKSRVNVEWLCAKEPPVIGPVGAAPGPGETTPAAAKPGEMTQLPAHSKGGAAGFRKSTLHSFFWGALQSPSPALKTPEPCKSMRQVKLPMNYAFALITVFSAGIWAPMRVDWQCMRDSGGAFPAPAAAPKGIPVFFSPANPGAPAPAKSGGWGYVRRTYVF